MRQLPPPNPIDYALQALESALQEAERRGYQRGHSTFYEVLPRFGAEHLETRTPEHYAYDAQGLREFRAAARCALWAEVENLEREDTIRSLQKEIA